MACTRIRIGWVVVAMMLGCLNLARAWEQPSQSSSKADVRVQMRNIHYHFSDAVAVQITRLDGAFEPVAGNLLPIFDNKNSFRLQIDSAQISITPDSLARVLNSNVFARSGAPLKGISITIDNGKLTIKGKLHNKGDIPFQMEGQLKASEDGRIRVHAEHVKALHLPVKSLMDLFGVTIAGLIKSNNLPGISLDKDDLLLNPEQVLPPPHIKGQVTQIRIGADSIVLIFGQSRPQKPILNNGNYMAFNGNRLRFGKLTMSDTDMMLIDMDPHDPFDFYLDHYVEQLAAGYTKITPRFGLRVFMRDYNRLHRTHR